MPTTMCLYFRGDGATRALDAFRRALGAEAETLIVHPNRDDSGYYGSAEVLNVDTAREAFATARQPFPALKAYLGVLPPERDQAAPPPGARRGGEPRGRVERPERPERSETKPGGGRGGEGRAGSGGATSARGQEQAGAGEAARPAEQNGRKPSLRSRGRNERRSQPDPEQPSQGPNEG